MDVYIPQEVSESLSGPPVYLDEFMEARMGEVMEMESQCPTPPSFTRRSDRRRATSHMHYNMDRGDVYRQIQRKVKTKRPYKCLPTHNYLSKRMKMSVVWDWYLPIANNQFDIQSLLRLSQRSVIVEDHSYASFIHLYGETKLLLHILSGFLPSILQNLDDIMNTTRVITDTFYEYGKYPMNAIGPVTYFGMKSNMFESETISMDMNPTNYLSIWFMIHPLLYNQVVQLLHQPLYENHIYADYLTNLSMYCIRGERCSTFLSKIFQHFSPNTDARNEDVYNYKFMDDVRAGNLSGMNATSYRNRNPMKSKEELKQQMSPKPTLYSSMTTGLSLSAEPASTTSPEQNNNSYMVDNLTYPNFDTLTTGQSNTGSSSSSSTSTPLTPLSSSCSDNYNYLSQQPRYIQAVPLYSDVPSTVTAVHPLQSSESETYQESSFAFPNYFASRFLFLDCFCYAIPSSRMGKGFSGYNIILDTQYALTLYYSLIKQNAIPIGLNEWLAFHTLYGYPVFPADYPDSLQGLSALYQYYYSGETILDPMNTCAFPPASLPYYAFLITMEATVRSVQKYDQRFQGKQFCIARDKTVISQLLPKKNSVLYPCLEYPYLVPVNLKVSGSGSISIPSAILALVHYEKGKDYLGPIKIYDYPLSNLRVIGFLTSYIYSSRANSYVAIGYCSPYHLWLSIKSQESRYTGMTYILSKDRPLAYPARLTVANVC